MIGRARALEGHESSKLPNSAHLFASLTWSGGPGYWKGSSPPTYLAQPTSLCFHLGQVGPGIGRARVLEATRLSPPFYIFNLVGQARASDGHGVLQATQSQATLMRHQPQQPVRLSTVQKRQDPRLLDDYFTLARALGDPPMTTSTTQQSEAGLIPPVTSWNRF
jgi:hypothetical protein